MSRTAWSRASSVPSDRIPPSNTRQASRHKGAVIAHGTPKSKEVLKLEGLVATLKEPSGTKDPKGGCFCKARVHPLSKYTPICMQCGLVICSLHDPYYPCPHCASSLLTPSSRDALVSRLTAEISEVVVREREQREHEQQERQKAVGAFPTLISTTGVTQDAGLNQPRKVLSLNARTKKVTVASYLPAPPTSYVYPSVEDHEAEEVRVPPPPQDVDFVKGKDVEGARWQNLRVKRIMYVPLQSQGVAEGSGKGRRRRKKGTEKNAS